MPTFGLLDEDYKSDENAYIGHKDLFLKRFAFPTIKPLDKVVSTAVHSTLSRLLREKHSPLGRKELGGSEIHSTATYNISNSFSPLKASTPEIKCKEEGCSAETIADYYIQKAKDRFDKKPVEKTVLLPPTGLLRKCSNSATNDRNQIENNGKRIYGDAVFSGNADSSCERYLSVDSLLLVRNCSVERDMDIIAKAPSSATYSSPSKSLENCYVAEMRLAEACEKAKKHMEEDKEQSISINRYGEKPLQLPAGDPVRYAYMVAIESYMSLVERDPPLVHVISLILIRICEGVSNFESVLLGKIMRSSQLLTLNEEKCTAFTKQVAATEDMRFSLIPETSAIKLFINLHVVGLSSEGVAHFTEKGLWNVISFLISGELRTFATSAILLELIEIGNAHLMRLYPQRWRDAFNKIVSTLIPRLQDDINKNDIRRNAGEDVIVSNLRHAVLGYSAAAVSAK
ncbi:hypothetical protein NECAME_13971 [Necator americanus]|uniref:Nucleoporin GLE1 n=1 Tax=Necator americanus TaxID=51031 RepID=W2SRH8_NECAM|nr:hypothetical protein NECAME_13971 [Necator americanus]ETN72133.1 hypothetical protein NECAME_13971 [Necator americanus]